MKHRVSVVLVLVGLFFGCSSGRPIDYDEPTRLLGKENDVRLDAQIFANRFTPNAQIGITWSVENLRPEPIVIADLIPEIDYDPDNYEITVHLGSEVPGNEFLPRLIQIRSGEKRTFEMAARLDIGSTSSSLRSSWPRSLRIRLSFLKDPAPFEALIDLKERIVYDPQRANELFIPWVDNHLAVTTNSIPISWLPAGNEEGDAELRRPRRRSVRAPRSR